MISWLRSWIARQGTKLFSEMTVAQGIVFSEKESYPQSYPHQSAAGVTVTVTGRRQQEPRNRHQTRRAKRRAALQAMR